MNNYEVTEDLINSHGLRLLIKEGGTSKIIVIQEDIEHWIYKRADLNNISPNDFDLPTGPTTLHSIPRVEKTRKFQSFYASLLELDDIGIKKLESWLIVELEG